MRQFLFLLLLCSLSTVHAQTVLTGVVTNKSNGKPLEGVSVSIPSTNAGMHTNANGQYRFTIPSKGQYTLQVSYLGYKQLTTNINATGNTIQTDFSLEETGLFVKPVEISSLRVGEHAPFTQSTLTAEEIKKQNLGQDLPLLLNQLPGVVTNSDAGTGIGYTGIRVRGSDITRINVTANGIPINDAESQGTFFVNMPDFASSVSSIQLQRGVGTSTNGAGAFGASLNLSTNDFRDKAYAEVNSSVGSYNSWKNTVKVGSGLINNHFTIDARLSKISSDGYMDRASSDLKSFYTSAAYISKNTAIRLNVFSGKEKTYQAWNGVPLDSLKTHRTYNSAGQKSDGTYYDNETDNYQQDHYQLFLNQSLSSKLDFNVAAHYTRGRGYYEQYREQEAFADYGITDPVINGAPVTHTDLIRQLWLDNHFYGGIFSVNYKGDKLSWSLGGGWNRYEGGHYGKIIWAQYPIDKDHKYYDNDAFKRDLNVYWKGQYKITSALRLFADLQYRTVQYNIDGFDKNPSLIQHNDYNFFNPKAGISYTLNDRQEVYASFAVGNKEPNRDDFEAGVNNTPKHETLRDVEAGYTYRTGNIVLQANAYYMNYKNQLVQTGKLNDVGAYTRTNIPKSYRAGIELQGSTRLGRLFTLSANAAFSRNKVQNFQYFIDNFDTGAQDTVVYNSTNIAFSPSFVGGYNLSARPVKNLEVSLIGKYVSRQYLDNSEVKERSLDGYYTNDLRFNYIIPQPLFKELGIQFVLNNIWNKKYAPNGWTYAFKEEGVEKSSNGYYPMAGTNFFAGINIAF
ncbi:TonB-dependent receptor [Chitinophaga pinensis]|uniref:TonB-dependent receptor n=1 Tax=Chitinophaga pinensis (strain ATCC 43595 / DSM 2588 / LMG 13176 / NBRC 15968 / NCIMB 11800 / UQM 2034) TaxID=485918 RepID=A0A979GZH7_CHIPD|nr:TonB-dependent receptor [Chitinophaga pinensis]ACU63951.1 TonB-dependent receptor [Chitinophaga pinensis DSM 2588]